MRTLTDLGVSGAEVRLRGDTPEVFVPDPNSIRTSFGSIRPMDADQVFAAT